METRKFDRAFYLFDEYNSKDQKKEQLEGKEISSSLLYAYRMTEKLMDFEPNSSPHLRLAAHCQHIGRWEIPRNDFPLNRAGYLKWRSQLKIHHAEIAGKLLHQAGYSDDIIEKVKDLVLKKQLKQNPETQTLEDVICLVFLEHYFDDFSSEHNEEKLVHILKKTIVKMSSKGVETALKLPLSEKANSLISKASC
jgi:hypothetical protein